MSMGFWSDLAKKTVVDPAEAARRLLALDLGREVLWLALALAIVLNAALQATSNLILSSMGVEVPALVGSVIPYAAVVGGGLIVTIVAFHQIGIRMGGTGTFSDVMVLLVWLQFLKVLVQAAGMIFLLTVPILSALLSAVAFLVGIYITVHFIDQAHRLNSLAVATGVLVLSILAIAVLAILLLSLVGGPITGTPAYV